MKNQFGSLLKSHRMKLGLTLREFCEAHKFDPGNYSRMERGLLQPPQREELLDKYATALKLKRGSDEWLEFFDTAAAARGELPKDILTDDEVVGKLPILFRILRRGMVKSNNMDELVRGLLLEWQKRTGAEG